MLILRLTQSSDGPDQHRVEIALEDGGLARQTAVSVFSFALTAQDREDVRWYLEDFLQYPLDPAPTIAARIERRMGAIGVELFDAIFQSNADARDLWATLRGKLNNARVEIVAGVREATTLPWELLRDPKTDRPLALEAQAFVRTSSQTARRPRVPQSASGPIRILLAICRPGGGDDVPFRSVASRLLKGLSEASADTVQLDVLRPPTFAQLGRRLRAAKAQGEPYHMVHFDGHGGYGEGDARPGEHGFLFFENPDIDANSQPVDGPSLGNLLAETDVPVLVLNACRSAHAEPPSVPLPVSAETEDLHATVRALGSLAQEVVDAGAAGVVAMRYNVYVETAAKFMADLYGPLAQGRSLGEAVSFARKQLAADPRRSIAYEARALQDWQVPVVYEAAPIALFPKWQKSAPLTITLGKADGNQVAGLPPRPDAGFFGRDETLLALDRAFDSQSVVLLHAYAGSGKTTTAAEFARWYKLTGGVSGPVLFTSFEQYRPLSRVLDPVGQVFGGELENAGVQWQALSDEDRRAVALQVLKQIPVLWIWDNVEPVTGFPSGTAAAWTGDEQRELASFLRETRGTKAKFLLTSRRDERTWLADLPRRIAVPPMPFRERLQLARALAEKHGRRLTDVEDWRPLLEFTQGNPLTITVLVGQAFRFGIRTAEEVENFVDRLRAGEAAFEDEAEKGRTRSLGASLSYGFEHAFNEAERRQLALLYLFQGFVDVNLLCHMGNPNAEWCLSEVRGLTREVGIAILDRASEVGLLTAHGRGHYSIHPALPWFFKKLFDRFYVRSGTVAAHAFVDAMGEYGDHYATQYQAGNREVIGFLTLEESNLLHARRVARAHGWWRRVIGVMQGLMFLYAQTGRRLEWARLVEEIVPDFVDPVNDGPAAGREEEWGYITGYRIRLLREVRQWEEAARLLRICVEWDRRRAAAALSIKQEDLNGSGRNAIFALAASNHGLGDIQRVLVQPECIESYKESYRLALHIDQQSSAASAAFSIGAAYTELPALRNFAEAERWIHVSLNLSAQGDQQNRSKCFSSLGAVAYLRFSEARAAGQPERELLGHIKEAARLYREAVTLLPTNAINELGAAHSALGSILADAGSLDDALRHFRESIRYREIGHDLFGAATTQHNVAIALMRAGRLTDAKEYAGAAVRNCQSYGNRAAKEIQETLRLIADIDHRLKAKAADA
ncbi:MAG: CHAT domain-containing protein [Bryobacteraceae bacterium]